MRATQEERNKQVQLLASHTKDFSTWQTLARMGRALTLSRTTCFFSQVSWLQSRALHEWFFMGLACPDSSVISIDSSLLLLASQQQEETWQQVTNVLLQL